MSYAMQTNDVIRIQCFCYDFQQLQLAINTFYWQVNAGTTMTDQTLAVAVYTDVAGLYRGVLHNQAGFIGVRISDLTPAPRPTTEFLGTTGLLAGTMGAPIPDQVSGLIGAHGIYSRKGQSARCYIPFPGSLGLTTFGNCSSSYTNGLICLATAFFSSTTFNLSATLGNFSPIIFHRAQTAPRYPRPNKSKRYPGTLPQTPQAVYGISTFYASGLWANQKRRDQRRRLNSIVSF